MAELYNIMIVDDEPWALVYLKKNFDRPDLGFQVAAANRNPANAMNDLGSLKPDVLVTDIRMPAVNGIELIEHVRHLDFPCEVVIVSGFAEFSYAQRAISLGAFEYCLKPLSEAAAAEILLRLRGKLDRAVYSKEPEAEEAADGDDNFLQMLRHIRENYNRRLYLKDLAQQFYLAPNYCCTLFLKTTGKTFSQYVTGLRMAETARLLVRPELSINKISEMVGFDDYAYFNKVFKRAFGTTPSEYRRQLDGTGS